MHFIYFAFIILLCHTSTAFPIATVSGDAKFAFNIETDSLHPHGDTIVRIGKRRRQVSFIAESSQRIQRHNFGRTTIASGIHNNSGDTYILGLKNGKVQLYDTNTGSKKIEASLLTRKPCHPIWIDPKDQYILIQQESTYSLLSFKLKIEFQEENVEFIRDGFEGHHLIFRNRTTGEYIVREVHPAYKRTLLPFEAKEEFLTISPEGNILSHQGDRLVLRNNHDMTKAIEEKSSDKTLDSDFDEDKFETSAYSHIISTQENTFKVSPDGQKFAYLTKGEGHTHALNLYHIDSSRVSQTPLENVTNSAIQLTFSSDSKLLLFQNVDFQDTYNTTVIDLESMEPCYQSISSNRPHVGFVRNSMLIHIQNSDGHYLSRFIQYLNVRTKEELTTPELENIPATSLGNRYILQTDRKSTRIIKVHPH